MKRELEDSEPNQEAQLLYGSEGRYGIYQLKDSEEIRDIRFMDMDYFEKKVSRFPERITPLSIPGSLRRA